VRGNQLESNKSNICTHFCSLVLKMKIKKKILIAGIGNLLFTDEGIGVHVIRELSKRELPEEIELADLGTTTFELIRFMEGKDKVVIVDAIVSNQTPGIIFKLTQDDLKSTQDKFSASLHQFGIVEALRSAALSGNQPEVVIFGITPKDYQSLGTELTSELKEAIPKIVDVILKEIE
jgi:hydrogenase maturation protease